MMKKLLEILFVALLVVAAGCQSPQNKTLSQVSTINALLDGVYDGEISCRQIMKRGDFGLGTFNRLAGEMVILDGTLYQIKADGQVYTPDPSINTPFAAVCQFNADKTLPVKKGSDYQAVKDLIDQHCSSKNLFYAIEIKGRFKDMTTRSVPAQTKPYPPLKEVAEKEEVFPMKNVTGTIVGFRCPAYVKGINVVGYHLHFISDDHRRGGHVLSFKILSGTCRVERLNKFFLHLPDSNSEFAEVDMARDRTRELHEVEQ